ncbi:MAG: hypothetical protein ACTSUO_04145 [Candidatus Thorarchaeota archaeon]
MTDEKRERGVERKGHGNQTVSDKSLNGEHHGIYSKEQLNHEPTTTSEGSPTSKSATPELDPLILDCCMDESLGYDVVGTVSLSPKGATPPMGRSNRVDRRLCPSTEEEYNVLLEKHLKVKESATFEKDDHHARAYFKMKTIIESGDISHLSARAQCKSLAKKFSVKFGTVKSWFMQNKIPKLVGWLGRLERKRLGIDPKDERTRQEFLPETLDDYLALVKRHPHVREHPDFEQRDFYGRIYFEIRETRANHPKTSFTKLSEMFESPRSVLVSWISGKSVPDIFQQLVSNEWLLQRYDAKISEESTPHRVNHTVAYEVLRPLKNVKTPSTKVLVDIVSQFCSMIPEDEKVIFVEFKLYNRHHGPRWIPKVGEVFESQLVEIERFLNEKFDDTSIEYRLGYADRTLYIWKRLSNSFDYLSLFGDESFYIDKDELKNLLQTARNHLNLRGNYRFGDLLRQITDVDDFTRKSMSKNAGDVCYYSEYIFGVNLEFILDMIDIKLVDISPKILAIGQQEQIKKPNILDTSELLDLMARFFAITASDGHVGQLWNFLGYHEYNLDRIAIVENLVKKLGDVTMSYFHDGARIAGIRLPHVLGRLMIKLGIPSGDKSIQSYGLPDFILNGSPEIMRAYLEEVIPEDGSVKIYDKSKAICIGRNAILYDIEKGERYRFEQKLTMAQVQFIKRHGKNKKGMIKGKILNVGKLRALSKSDRPKISDVASEILQIAYNNPVVLLNHEQIIIQKLGMTCQEPKLSQITWCEKTGRVSSTWRLNVCNLLSIAKWGLLASPNDLRKKAKLVDWMKSRPDVVSKAMDELQLQHLYP